MLKTINNQGKNGVFREYGHAYAKYTKWFGLSQKEGFFVPDRTKNYRLIVHGREEWGGTILYGGLDFIGIMPNNVIGGYTFHSHMDMPPGWKGTVGTIPKRPRMDNVSDFDTDFARDHQQMSHFMGWSGGLVQFGVGGIISNLARSGWWKINCDNLK